MAFKIIAEPTFKALVKIPLPGGGFSEPVEFVFKHRAKTQLAEYSVAVGDKEAKNIDVVMDTVSGWGFVEQFTRENVQTLLDNYHGAARAIVDTYMIELLQVRLGN